MLDSASINFFFLFYFDNKPYFHRSKCYWNILSVDDEKCVFDTLYQTIRLTVYVDKETEIVNKTDISYHISQGKY